MKKKLMSVVATALFLLSCIFTSQGITANPTPIAFNNGIMATVNRQLTAYPSTLQAELTEIDTESQGTSVPTPSVNSQNWLKIWLSKPTCQPPCWENITPGETTFNDAARIIAKIPGVKFDSITLTPHPVTQAMYAYWNFGRFGEGSMSTGYKGNVINELVLQPNKENILTIDEVIKSFGAPSSVVQLKCRGGGLFSPTICQYGLIFKKIGIFLFLDKYVKINESVDIKSDDQVNTISFYKPLQDPNSPTNPLPEAEYYYSENMNEIKWNGYVVYGFKNQQ